MILLPIESIIVAHSSKSSAQRSVIYTCQWEDGRAGSALPNDLA